MKAAYLEEIEKLAIREIPYPQISDGDIILKVKSVAICGTDIKIFKFGHVRISLPWILGHEIAGEIVEVGKNVMNYNIGDKVVVNPTVFCGTCYYCRRGLYNICLHPSSYGYERSGGFVQYMRVHEDTVSRNELYHIPSDTSFDEAALTEPFACVINGHKDIKINPDSSVVIFGGGPIGIMHGFYARLRGAKKIILIEINAQRAKGAAKFSIFDHIFTENYKEYIKDITDGIGPDVGIVAAPSPDAQREVLEVVRKRGEIVYFASLPKGHENANLNTNIIHYKELKIFGSSNSVGLNMQNALSIISSERIPIKELITHRFSLTNIDNAFKKAMSPCSYKVIVNP